MNRVIKFTVITKKWRDRINGNTYHSVRCVRCVDNAIVVGEFQYGYGEHYKQTALYKMFDAEWLPDFVLTGQGEAIKPLTKVNLMSYERFNNYPILWTVSEGLKRDCIANGKL